MNEYNRETSDEFQSVNQPGQSEWQAPPLPEQIKADSEPPQMSEVETLGNIFFEPGRTFEDLRRKPHFILASLICLVMFTMFASAFNYKIGYERITRERLEASSWYRDQSPEVKKQMLEQQGSAVAQYISMAVVPIVVLITFFIGGLIYWGGANAMGGSMTYLRGVAVWVYAGFPPLVISTLANLLILFLKSPDDIDVVTGQQGLINANPTFFMDTKAMPVLSALVGTFDLFFIWGWILAAIGLRIVGKISSGAAWTIVLLAALLNVAARVVGAFFQG